MEIMKRMAIKRMAGAGGRGMVMMGMQVGMMEMQAEMRMSQVVRAMMTWGLMRNMTDLHHLPLQQQPLSSAPANQMATSLGQPRQR
jgi:hypothetical protein